MINIPPFPDETTTLTYNGLLHPLSTDAFVWIEFVPPGGGKRLLSPGRILKREYLPNLRTWLYMVQCGGRRYECLFWQVFEEGGV
jgi:hypothetical protein